MGHHSKRRSSFKRATLRKQGGRCAICQTSDPSKFHLDHDHKTGGYRGVLCNSCNHGLGFFCDSPELLRNAARYLEIPRTLRYPRFAVTQREAAINNLKKAHALSRTERQRQHSILLHLSSSACKKGSERSAETKRRQSESAMGNQRALGHLHSRGTKKLMRLAWVRRREAFGPSGGAGRRSKYS